MNTTEPPQGSFSQVRRKVLLLLRNPPVRNSSRITRLLSWPLIVTTQLLGLEGQTRVSFPWSSPDADEVIDRYLRGYVLFGRPAGRLAKFEWQSFDARAIATGENAKIPSRLRGLRRNSVMEVRFDQDLLEVARACQEGRSDWPWLTDELVDLYLKLGERGWMSTVGTYRDGQLVGGLLGISVGRTYSLMSVFHRENHAGSVALAALVDIVKSDDGRWSLIDFGHMTPHFERFGAVEVSEERLLELLKEHGRSGTSAEKLEVHS